MSLQFTTNDARQVLASTDSLREFTTPNTGDAKVLEEFPVYSGDSAGKGIDLGFTLYGRVMRSRAVALPLPHGCAQCVLTCGVDEFKTAQQKFGGLLTSFQRVRAAAEKK